MESLKYKYNRKDVDFLSNGERCSAWLYLPETDQLPPVIIMAHGFAAEKSFELPKFAKRFAENGLAVLLFDYRCFGDSEGMPRNYVNPFRHIQDWKSAVKYIKQCNSVDVKRIALWGSSFSGGHVISVASQIEGISAFVSQVPYVDGLASMFKTPPLQSLKATYYSIKDVISTFLFKKVFYVKAVAEPGEFAAMNSTESWPGYTAMIPEDSKWKNKIPAKIFLMLLIYSPLLKAKKVKCPALVIGARHDSLIPYQAVMWTAARIKKGEFILLDCNHFQPYKGEWFERNIKAEIDFLKRHLIY
jgi:pimeloyl-ACP methyl ester carboxylesterase